MQAARGAAPDPRSQLRAPTIEATIRDGFTLAAGGDLIFGRPQTDLRDPQFEAVAEILRSSAATFANLEMTIIDEATFTGYPAAENGGGNPTADAAVARDLKRRGIDIVSRATNHALDWGVEGMQETSRLLDAAGIAHAGSGRNRAAARAPAYLETPFGRVALVATASTFPPSARAGLAVGEAPGRPGISALRTERVILVAPDELDVLRRIARRHGPAVTREGDVYLLGQVFRASPDHGLKYRMNPYDHFEILKAVRGAKQTSDFTIFSIHAHETASGAATDPAPADFLPVLFREVIDAGADVVIAHGQHEVRGIEIYKGKPIFYGLASLFFQLDLFHAANRDVLEELGLDPEPATYVDYHQARFAHLPREWYESILPVVTWEGGVASEIRLYPLDLHQERAPKHRGFPTLATGEPARRILGRIREYSAQFGTEIEIRNETGYVRLR